MRVYFSYVSKRYMESLVLSFTCFTNVLWTVKICFVSYIALVQIFLNCAM